MSKGSSAKYYQNDKERTQRKAHERYQILSKEEKEKKKQHGHIIQNLPTDENQKFAECRKKYYKMTKNALL